MKYLLILATVLVTGCSFMARFDNVQYNHVSTIASIAELGIPKCRTNAGQKELANELHVQMVYLLNYVRGVEYNAYIKSATKGLDTIVTEFTTRVEAGPASEQYCSIKMRVIMETTDKIQSALGNGQ